jgi:radical SAM superfamily enzyme YgiQ (UPF0313 family)
MKKILLISPIFESGLRVFGDDNDRRPFMTPISVATVAALTPPDIQVDVWDEGMHGVIDANTVFKTDYDLVGVTGYSTQIGRVRSICQILRSRGIPIAMGGPAVSVTPDVYVDMADYLFVGEAEQTWPLFIKEWLAGSPRRMYRQVIKPNMSEAPIPRWSAIDGEMNRYFLGAVQTSRGCPYDCEFCDVPFIFGHLSRWKPVPQVLSEIEALQKLGVESIFFVDDNFIGDLKYARSLLKELVVFNRKFPRRVTFYTQATLNVARYDDMLELFADANFGGLFIGVESPNKESLKETKKLQNVYTDIVADLKKIQSYGLSITSGIIVGFDHDTTSIFDEQFEFLQEACIPMPTIGMLCAPMGTRLRDRMLAEGRLLAGDDDPIRRPNAERFLMPTANTNIIPAGMSRIELFQGYLGLHERIRDWGNFSARMKGFVSNMKRPPQTGQSEQETTPERIIRFVDVLASMDDQSQTAVMEILQYTANTAPAAFVQVIARLVIRLRYRALVNRIRGWVGLSNRNVNWDVVGPRIKRAVSRAARRGTAASDRVERMGKFIAAIAEPETRKAFIDIIQHTKATAPYMLSRVLRLLVMQLRQREMLARVRPLIVKRIELEMTPGFQLEFAHENLTEIPASFKSWYKTVFPGVYQNVYQNLADKSRAEEALIQVFTKFLTRWQDSLDRFEEHHVTDLEATWADIVEKENTERKPSLAIVTGPADFKKTRLPDEVLRVVQNELRRGRGAAVLAGAQ